MMRVKSIIIKIILISLLFINQAYAGNEIISLVEDIIDNDNRPSVLFIGSSYFSCNNLTQLFNNLAKKSKYDLFIGEDIINGTFLDYHASSTSTTNLIKSRKWDYVILQTVGICIAYPEVDAKLSNKSFGHDEISALRVLIEIIKNNYNGTKIILCMPWAFEDGLLWVKGQTEDFEIMQKKIFDVALSLCKELNIVAAPVGWAWHEIIQGKPALHYLFQPDFNHPNLRGSYLTACVLYSTLFKKSCAGINYYAGFEDSEAEYLQKTASKVVLENLEQWNIK